MTLNNPALQTLCDAASSKDPLSEEQLIEVRSLIKNIRSRTAQGENISIDVMPACF
jgi:hypothetical protein